MFVCAFLLPFKQLRLRNQDPENRFAYDRSQIYNVVRLQRTYSQATATLHVYVGVLPTLPWQIPLCMCELWAFTPKILTTGRDSIYQMSEKKVQQG